MLTSLLPSAPLADWCRMLRHQLGAGLSPVKVVGSLAATGPAPLRPVSARLHQAIKAGAPLGEALESERELFPELVVPLIHVGDETGHLPEVLAELEDYLREDDRIRKEFRQQTLLPKIQLFAAIAIVAGLIWILGIIGGPKPMTVFGLSGGSGAMIFLTATLGPILAFWTWSKSVAGTNAGRARLRSLGTRLPVVGPCLHALMMSRFSLALQLTLNSSLSPAKALRLSFSAAGDAELNRSLDDALAAVKKGKPLHEALADCTRLPAEFLDILATAEESGSIPEMMKHQAIQYRELARDRLKTVAQLAAGVIWLMVAIFIIINIFRIAFIYLDALKI